MFVVEEAAVLGVNVHIQTLYHLHAVVGDMQ